MNRESPAASAERRDKTTSGALTFFEPPPQLLRDPFVLGPPLAPLVYARFAQQELTQSVSLSLSLSLSLYIYIYSGQNEGWLRFTGYYNNIWFINIVA